MQLSTQDCKPWGGGDVPEDVLGALDTAASFEWGSGTRFVVLMTDAPAHGKDCNNRPDDK